MSEQPRQPSGSGEPPQDRLLAGSRYLDPTSRSALLEALARVVHPTTLVIAAYLLLVGLHHPGAGSPPVSSSALGCCCVGWPVVPTSSVPRPASRRGCSWAAGSSSLRATASPAC
ncbi:hypothetical protein [Nocardioides sp. TF02-7]|uniref:hypothetical protein n=1 Tax=Nocardioides sp. TF02-7 TaxID=2917724 RepID=UPI001F054779|nr:hypothetical protein [Nocardioides sp. TF02-7]UMG94983.1 hypothetical protein MF408_17575 [Nocardioides sp. TF02-7]